jgi:hypothetical protein
MEIEATRRQVIFGGCALALAVAADDAIAQRPLTVVFICEHGYAKSLVAARHFERLAEANGVPVRALSRGVDPGLAVPAAIADGLVADGFSVAGLLPTRITTEELHSADYVVLIAVEVDVSGRSQPTLRWDDVSPLSENYDRARDELVAHDIALLRQIAADAARDP